MEERKEQIIKWLKEFERIPSSRFVGLLGMDYQALKKLLDEMEKDGLIMKEEETLATYWRIKNETNDN